MAKDFTLVLESPNESEDENQWEEPADNSPHDKGRADMGHFVFDMPQREIITPSHEVPPMTEDLVGSPWLPGNQSPETEKSALPSPAQATSVRPASSDSIQKSTAYHDKQTKCDQCAPSFQRLHAVIHGSSLQAIVQLYTRLKVAILCPIYEMVNAFVPSTISPICF